MPKINKKKDSIDNEEKGQVTHKLEYMHTKSLTKIFKKGNVFFNVKNAKLTPNGVKTTVSIHCNDNRIHKDSIALWNSARRTSFAKKCKNIPHDFMDEALLELDDLLQTQILEEFKELEKEVKIEFSKEAKEKALKILKSYKLLYTVKKVMERLGVTGENVNKLMLYMNGTSRLLPKPICLIYKGSSASGKSFPIDRIKILFPKDEYKDLTDVSKNALYYYPKDCLVHMWVIIFERVGSESANYSIRSLISEGKLKKDVVIKNPKTGMFETKSVEKDGPIAFIETTTKAKINDENETRVFSLYTDECIEQTERIFKVQNKKYKAEECEISDDEINSYQAVQKMFKKVKVFIPYVDEFTEYFPKTPIRVRRDHESFLALIETSAFLHQYQRPHITINGNEYIVATFADYHIAYVLGLETLSRSIKSLSPQSENILNIMKDFVRSQLWTEKSISEEKEIIKQFGYKQIEQKTKKSPGYIKKWVEPLIDCGYFDIVREGEKGSGNSALFKIGNKDYNPHPLPDVNILYQEFLKNVKMKNDRNIFETLENTEKNDKCQNDVFEYIRTHIHELIENIYDPLTGESVYVSVIDDLKNFNINGENPKNTTSEKLNTPKNIKNNLEDNEPEDDMYVDDVHAIEILGESDGICEYCNGSATKKIEDGWEVRHICDKCLEELEEEEKKKKFKIEDVEAEDDWDWC